MTGGNGVNYSFEAVGNPETLEQALWCRDLAGTCVIIGVPGPAPQLDARPARFFDLGGSAARLLVRRLPADARLPAAGRRGTRRASSNLDEVVTREITLDETEEAFDAMKRGETLRIGDQIVN